MANLDIPATQAELQQRETTVKERIYGLENYLRLDLNDDEKAKVDELRTTYIKWAGALATLKASIVQMVELLPRLSDPLPTMEVPNSMKATLDKERHETEVADDLFTTSPTATHLEAAVEILDQ